MQARTPFLAAVLIFASAPVAAQGTRYTVSGSDVAIYNIAGVVRVEPGNGSSVVAEVSLLGPDASRLEVREASGRLAVVYPSNEIVYAPLGRNSETTTHVNRDGTFFGDWARNGRQVRISGDGDGLEAHADMRILVPAGRTVAVYLAVGKLSASNVNGNLTLDVASADVEVSGTRGSLNLDLGSGNVSVTDAEGDMLMDTGSGDVTISNIRGGRLELDTGSGSITGSRISAERMLLDAGSGDIRLSEVASRDLSLDTGSGEVEIGLTTDVDRLSLDSGSGDVTIRAPANLGARVDIETGSGRVSGDLISGLLGRGEDEDDDHVTGTIGDGQGTITVDTGSGDVSFVSR
jgi:hypothetical protein